jgi:hypothetical protein
MKTAYLRSAAREQLDGFSGELDTVEFYQKFPTHSIFAFISDNNRCVQNVRLLASVYAVGENTLNTNLKERERDRSKNKNKPKENISNKNYTKNKTHLSHPFLISPANLMI